MLFFMGASACGVMREAMVQQRYADRAREARRACRMTFQPGTATEWQQEVEWESFPCFHLCLLCGYLSDDFREACPGCGGEQWADLRRLDSAEAIRKMERRDRLEIPDRILWNGRIAAGVLACAVAPGVYFIAVQGEPMRDSLVMGGLAFVAVLVPGVFLFPRLWNSIHFSRRRTYPSRWHLPLPLPSPGAEPVRVLEGVPAAEDVVEAPISKQPCLGYEATVLFDDLTDKRPPMWILEEEQTCAFVIDGHRVEANRVTIQLPTSPVARDEGSVNENRVSRFLRQRGLFTAEGRYTIHEARIDPQERYRVELYDEPPGAAAIIRPAK